MKTVTVYQGGHDILHETCEDAEVTPVEHDVSCRLLTIKTRDTSSFQVSLGATDTVVLKNYAG